MSAFDFTYEKSFGGFAAPKNGHLMVVVMFPTAKREIRAQSVQWHDNHMFATISDHETVVFPSHSYINVTVAAFTERNTSA